MIEKLSLPDRGRPEEDLLAEMEKRKEGDADWRHGRSWSLVYYGGDEHDAFLKRAYCTYFSENGVSPSAFPSLARLEAEVVAMTLSLLGAKGGEVGTMAAGGTESILLAMKAYRDRARARGMKDKELEILVPESAHPAFFKAAHYFDLRTVPAALGTDFRVDPRDVERKITKRTTCIVASAPSYPQGVVDPIPELAEIAQRHRVGLHVDACLGGFVLPFMKRLGHDVPEFDFGVDGVTSISSDLHKNGYTAKGASVVLYRTAELRSYQFFVTADWPGGLYGAPSMTGTRPGGAIAASWAALMRLGVEGYTDMTRRALDVAERLMQGIRQIPGLQIIGKPDMTVFTFGVERLDIFAIAARLEKRGWRMDRQRQPDSLHMIATYGVTSHIPDTADPADYMRQQMGKVYDLS
jgi:glutamate/tyrosine decarboxylase-like PLP-dependent enzyme